MPTVIRARQVRPMPRRARSRSLAARAVRSQAGFRFAGGFRMDLIGVDFPALGALSIRGGALVTLLGGEIGVDELAPHAGTIGYEVLTSLGHRYHCACRAPA